MPGGKDVGKNYEEYKEKHPNASHEQVTAVALNQAHKAGNEEVGPPSKRNNKKEGAMAVPDLTPLFKKAHPVLRRLGTLHKVAAVRARMDGVPISGDMDTKNAVFTLGYKYALARSRQRGIRDGLAALRGILPETK